MNWKKLGQIFDPTKVEGKDFMNSHVQCPSTLIFDDFVRVYFSCRPKPVNGQYVSYTAFIDLDRKDLTKVIRIADKPIMELGALGTFDEFAIYPTSILDLRIAKTIFLYYAGWNRCQSVPYNCSIGMAISYDNGETFSRFSKGPILTRSEDEPFELSGPKIRTFKDKAYMFYLAGEGWQKDGDKSESIYKIRLAIGGYHSFDKLNKNIIPQKLNEFECQAGPDVFFKDGIYHMYFSYRYGLNFRNKERGYKIGYAYSEDLITWTRDDEQAGIKLSEEGWDSEMMHYPHVFELDNKWYMLYNGNDFGRYGLGLATMI